MQADFMSVSAAKEIKLRASAAKLSVL